MPHQGRGDQRRHDGGQSRHAPEGREDGHRHGGDDTEGVVGQPGFSAAKARRTPQLRTPRRCPARRRARCGSKRPSGPFAPNQIAPSTTAPYTTTGQLSERASPRGLIPSGSATRLSATLSTPEAAVALLVLDDGPQQVRSAEVGPQRRRHPELAVRDLPQQEVADSQLAARADEQVGIGNVGRVEPCSRRASSSTASGSSAAGRDVAGDRTRGLRRSRRAHRS